MIGSVDYMRRCKIKAQITGVSYLKLGGGVLKLIDTNCQRASQSLCESRAVSLFARLLAPTLSWRLRLSRTQLTPRRISYLFFPRIFEQTRDCSQSSAIIIVKTRYAISNNHSNRRATEYHWWQQTNQMTNQLSNQTTNKYNPLANLLNK